MSRAFQKLLSDLKVWRPPFSSLVFDRLLETEVTSLEVPFTKEAIFTTLFDLNGDKVPGQDGFTFAFWQLSWEFVKDDSVGMFKNSMSKADL